jgi:hypothetical protein
MHSVGHNLLAPGAQRKPRFPLIRGADGGIRTHDLPLTRRLLCQLSYVGKLVGEIARNSRVLEGP